MLVLWVPILRAHFRCRDLDVQSLLIQLTFVWCHLNTLTHKCARAIISCLALWFLLQVLRPLPQVVCWFWLG